MCYQRKETVFSFFFSTAIYPSEAAKDVQGRLQMASGRSALGQDSSRVPPQAGAGRGRKVPVPLQLGWLCGKRTVLATLTQDILQQAVSKQQPPDG